MIVYAIKIDGEYFNEYVYSDEDRRGRFAGHTKFGGLYRSGDIVDVITTKEPEYTLSRRSVGNTVSILLGIPILKGRKIEIIPMEE